MIPPLSGEMCDCSGKGVFKKKCKNLKCIISDLFRDILPCRRHAIG